MGGGDASCGAVLSGRGLGKRFGSQALFAGLDVDLHGGELVLLRGENGAGKTTLLDILTGNQRADRGCLLVRSHDGALHELDARRTEPTMLARLGVVKCWQRPELFWSATVGDNLRIAAAGGDDAAPRVLARALGRAGRRGVPAAAEPDGWLAALGLLPLAERGAAALSFGQGRRVSIALSAIAGTRALLLDEPLASLDRDATRAVNRLLGRLVAGGERAVLVVEHAGNERLLDGLSYQVLELRGRRLWAGERRAAVDGAGAPAADHWTSAVEGDTGLRRLGGAEPLGGGACVLRFGSCPAPAGAGGCVPLLAVAGLRARRGAWELFTADHGQAAGLSLAVRAGEAAFLLAPNGWGKSSLARVIAGELAAVAGSIRLAGEEVSRLPAWARRRRGLVYAETASPLFANLTVDETLRLERVPAGGPCDVRAGARRRLRTLSGGERQGLALHCALSGPGGRLVVLDEPFNGLDGGALTHWLGRCAAAVRQGKALLVCLPA